MSVRTYGKRGAKRKLNSDPNSEISSPKRPKIDSTEQPATPKAARDLSHIFDTALSASAPSTPTKLAQRMLGRSKTESSLENSRDSPSFSSKNLLDRTSSMPSFVSPTKSPLSSPTTAHAIEPSSSPQRPAMVNKRTYAGKSRSFLVAMTADHSLPEELQDDYNSRESYAALRSRWGVDNSEDDPYPEPEIPSPSKSVTSTPNSSPSKGKSKGRLKQEANSPNGVIKPLRSITEIRNKGESRRFLDEVGYLLEGMGKDETPALRKASALEIISRLCEPDFIRQAKAADFLQSTWDAFIEAGGGTGEDKVLDTLLVVFAALVSRDVVSLTDLAQRDCSPSSSTSSQSSFTSTLFSLVASLSPETDPLMIVSQSLTPDSPLKKLGITKTDRAVLKTLHSTFTSQARMFSSKTLISNAFLLTHTLTTIPTELLSHTHVLHLLRSLRAQLQPAISSINNLANVDFEYDDSTPSSSKATPVASSSTVLTTLRPIPFPVIHGLLSLLDSYLLAQWAPSRKPDQEKSRRFLDKARDEWLADGLLAVGISAELLAGKENKRRTDASSRCTEIVFRVLVSLTHSDPLWGQSLTKSSQAIIFIVRTIIRAGNLWGKNVDRIRRASISDKTSENGKNHSKKTQRTTATIPKVEVTDDYDKLTDHVSSEESENGRVDQPTKATERLQARALDWLCLSLGLLTNLVQVVEEAKTTVRNTKLDPNCIHKPLPCIHVCSCHNRMSVLDILVTTYKHQLPIIAPAVKTETHSSDTPLALELEQQQEAEADASFLLGHLSVLFGLLMMDSPENQEIVLDALPLLHSNHDDSKPSESKQQKLAQLAENASELGVFYAVISRRGLLGNSANDVGQNRMENDAVTGADVAKGVISFLRDLQASL
ncbi:hypothetical protein DFJ43DRAFT_1159423 [Lentinula guzmanii]|uniref:Wings apart-like protein C-terminal domain-containing protein n=1 Tax=Lentinula guzmanii TaxID=2804957 RepID=A0AA38J3X9_9AGAR|nr:hypothetical protein DFJ43DRAFT_1159423 [Lentinula guzmanii]